jgi:RNase H-like domain found in reverse transcriptase
MRSAISNCSERVAPLQIVLAKLLEGKSRRPKKAAYAVSLLQLWGPEENADFNDLQAAIMESMTLAFTDPDKRIYVLTDAFDRFYGGLMTQIGEERLDLPMRKQDHQPLAFLPGEFKGACYALLRMRPLSRSWAESCVVISCGKSIITNLTSEAMNARCGDYL